MYTIKNVWCDFKETSARYMNVPQSCVVSFIVVNHINLTAPIHSTFQQHHGTTNQGEAVELAETKQPRIP
jgi:hypothetical protein